VCDLCLSPTLAGLGRTGTSASAFSLGM
jgi:hypothetical protein